MIDLDDGNELADCAITLLPSNSVVTTNNHGQFIFNNLCSAEYTLVVQHLGCRDTLVKINLTKSLFVKIKLPHSAFELKEVDVMDKRIEMKQTQTVDMLDAKELKKVTGLPLAETLKNISGVTTLNTGATISKPMLHGMQGYRLLILNNGIRHEGQQWGNEHAPEIDPFIAKKVTVIKGVNSIRYGSDAIAGVVLVEPNELPDTAGINGEFNFAGFSNGKSGAGSIMLEGAFEKLKGFNWRVQGSLKKSGNIKTPKYFINNTGVNESNFSVALGYHYKSFGIETYYSQFNSEIGIYSGSHIGNLTDLQLAYLRSKPADSLTNFTYAIERPKQSVSHELFKTEMHYHFGARWRAKVQYAYQFNWRREFDLHLPKSEEKKALLENIPQVDYRITSQTADVLLEHDNIRSF
ncbi:MAG: TonB-dependent receptor, partial [Bacteroidia bacterium]|nr:TonB-dependent receptor [Bacteroidia bacterium]